MPSPFPGMDPYLEGYLWVDVHNALASKIRQQLVPQLRPRYTARLEIYLVEDTTPEGEISILYPDVEVLRGRQAASGELAERLGSPIAGTLFMTPASLTLPMMRSVEVRIATIEIRDTANNMLVACIEILSPVNKREPGLTPYRQKRQRLYDADVHLIEIDLLRRGTRPFNHPRLPNSAYMVTVTRAQSGAVEIWPIHLQDPLPIVPVPLKSPDADVPLDLGAAIASIYDEAAYDLSIDYAQSPPPPKLPDRDHQWLESWVGSRDRP
jgi:Protein of unknown function (DUF4058)